MIELPKLPMLPIRSEHIPVGDDWGYQLKWDGVRILARIEAGDIQLISRNGLHKNTTFPEVVNSLTSRKGTYLLDGEVVYFDPVKNRPVFQQVLQRERMRQSSLITESGHQRPLSYVLFDLLYDQDTEVRALPYSERYRRLQELFPERNPTLFVTDLFSNGEQLWDWVQEHEWEGIVSKRLSSFYKEGKKHQDWYKKKTALHLHVSIVGVLYREGRVASLIMAQQGRFLGRVSLGLNEKGKQQIDIITSQYATNTVPFPVLPKELRKEKIRWLSTPFPCTVTGTEITNAGYLRHPKIKQLTILTTSISQTEGRE